MISSRYRLLLVSNHIYIYICGIETSRHRCFTRIRWGWGDLRQRWRLERDLAKQKLSVHQFRQNDGCAMRFQYLA